jgi:hypothetical protein
MAIGAELEHEAYRVANSVNGGKLTPAAGIRQLVAAGINPNSARDYIYILKSMLHGEVYKRAMSTGATKHFLEQIKCEYGSSVLARAVGALRKHILYKGGSMPGYLRIAEEYEALDGRFATGWDKPGLQILPMSSGEWADREITTVQEEYFLDRLPRKMGGRFRCYTAISAPPGSTILFQYRAMIVASARLLEIRSNADKSEYPKEMIFAAQSVRVFEPIDGAVVKAIWPKVKQLDQTRWKLDFRQWPRFERSLQNVRAPDIHDEDGAADLDVPAEYIPSFDDNRIRAQLLIRLRRGQQKFRLSLFRRYGEKCLVTGSTVVALLEAAHIVPYRGDQDHHSDNGLILRSDIHTLFDLDLLGIVPDSLKIELHPTVAKEYGAIVASNLLCSPSNRPSKRALEIRYAVFLKNLKKHG